VVRLISTPFSAAQLNLSKAKIVVLNPRKKIMANAADMLRNEVEKRTRIGLEVVTDIPDKGEAAIVIGLSKDVEKICPLTVGLKIPRKADSYALWLDLVKRNAATICLAGYDDRGTLFAVGKLLRLLKMSRDKVEIDSEIKVSTVPRYSLRGHQLGYRPKTNSYDAWTLEMWEQYYRDMIVFGMNAVELLPPRTDDAADSPHFPKPQLEMMVVMSQMAADYGLDVWIWFPAIEDDYSDQKTVKVSLEEWEEVFRKLPKIEAVFVPGGDPGNTHPAILLPFIEKQKKSLNRYHPKAQMWVSPQGFDRKGKNRDGWLRAFLDILQRDEPAWLDGIVFGSQVEMRLEQLKKEVPERYPIRRYPDITHSHSCQYPVPDWDHAYQSTLDREPINPRPLGYAKIFRDLQQHSIGFITYSEGCNDDVNKILWSCLGWDPDMDVKEIMKEYSRYFISQRFEDKFTQGLLGLEQNWEGPLLKNESVYNTLRIFQEMEKDATPQDKLNWRFQQGLYRAYYDAYIKARLEYETCLEKQARAVLNNANEIGAINAINEAEAILDKAVAERVKPEWRARVFEMAEALYQSIRMQMSVDKFQAIAVRRGANLDNIDVRLNNSKYLKKQFVEIRKLQTEKERIDRIVKIKFYELAS
jgi:hypothetical protein